MRKQALALMACLIFAALFAGIAATSASATPTLGACTGCHNGGGAAPVVTETANTGTTATFTVSAPGAAGWAVFQGSTRLGGSEGTDKYVGATATGGTFTVPVGATYTIYAGTDLAIGVATVSPTSNASSFIVTPTAGPHGAISPNTPQTVARDGSITFSFTPAAGYAVADVLVNGASKGASSSYTITHVTATTSIDVQFAPAVANYTITASAGANGAVDPTGPQTVASGAEKTFTITPNAGYYPQVTIDGHAVAVFKVGGVYAYTFTNVTTNHEIVVAFAASPAACTITATVGSGGIIIPNQPNPYNLYPGSSITYAFVPDAGYHVNQVIVNGTPVTLTDDEFTFEKVDQNYTLAVTFARNTHTITATADAHGSIAPAGATQVIEGDDSPAYSIAAASGYRVTNVTVDGVSLGIKTTYTFQDVIEDHTIAVATAANANAFAITPAAGAHGAITPATPFMVTAGSSVTFFFVPDAGYTVDAVTVDGRVQLPFDPTKDDLSYTFENVTANHTISVSFVVAPVPTYSITASAGPGGTISPAGVRAVTEGGSAIYAVTPDAHYTVTSVLVDGIDATLTNNTYTFTNVQEAHTIAVTFAVSVQKCSLTLSLSGLKAGVCKYGKSVASKGTIKPAWAAKVKITVQRKVSGAWKTVTTKARSTNARSGAYSWTYKPTKKGSYRIRTSVAKSTYYTSATSPWRTCKVK